MALRYEPTRAGRSSIVHGGHGGKVWSVAFSPDGKSVASGSSDETIRIRNASIPSPICVTGHTETVFSVAYSPLGDVLASGSGDTTVGLWDVNTGQKIEEFWADNSVFSVAFSPDGNLLASGSRTVQLWDVQKRTPASDPFTAHTSWIDSVAFSPDGTRLVSGSDDNTIRVWDVEHRVTVVGPLKGHTHPISSVSFSPDGSSIISGSWDRTIRLWDARSGVKIGNLFEGHTNMVNSVSFSPHGTYVASGGSDKTVRLWDVRTGRQLDQPFQEHTGSVESVAFSPCGKYIASGSSDCKVIIRSVADKVGVQVARHMSTQQMFNSLISTGCADLSSHMDPTQDTAMIMSGGGFGDIWLGRLHTGTKVAIKTWRIKIMEDCSDKSLKRAARELHNWSRLDHPNIHQLMGVTLFKDQYLGMVSEWMEHGNLHEYLRKQPDADRYRLCIHVASGLEYMHSRSTIHGDVKAANVLVSSDGVARLSDFDLSIMSEVSSLVFSESSNTRWGTTRWTAPEMLCEQPRRTTQTDVYALGMTMLEIFTGKVPYPECQYDFVVLKKVEGGTLPARPMETLGDNHKDNLMWELLLACWSRNPSDRPLAGQVSDRLIFYIYSA